MPEGLAGGHAGEPCPDVVQTQVAILTRYLDNNEAVTEVVNSPRADGLNRVLGAVLRGGRAVKHVAVVVNQKQVVVVGGRPERVGPLQHKFVLAVPCDRVLNRHPRAAVKVVADADRFAAHDQGASRGIVALPDSGPTAAVAAQIAAITGHGEVDAVVGDRRVNCLGDDAVLKGWLNGIDRIVDDDVRARGAQRLNVRRKLRLPSKYRGKVQLGAGREIVDDLQHRRPLVAFSRLSRQYRHPGRQVACRLSLGQRIDPIREHADTDTRPIDVVRFTRLVRPVGHIALGRVAFVSCPSRPGDG